MRGVTHSDRLHPHLRVPTAPIANPENVISGDRWRISVIDSGLIRLEWRPSGRFEDRASQTVLNRSGEPVAMTIRESEDTLEIITDRAHLTYDRGPFSPEGLSVQATGGVSNHQSVWRFGDQAQGNLGGTARTLDEVDGRTPLEPGILSRYGIAVHDDSESVLMTEDGWFAPPEPGSVDVYVFSYGRDYRAALDALYRLTGPQPLVPRFALGNWWSRYHAYTADEYLALMDRFAEHRVPLSVAVLDMDWHVVDIDPRYGSGWTGYTWNHDLFPDPDGFLDQLHRRSLRVTVNVHPADGIHALQAPNCRWSSTRPAPASSLPTWSRFITRSNVRASTSSGSTGNPVGSRECPDSTHCGFSTTSTSSIRVVLAAHSHRAR